MSAWAGAVEDGRGTSAPSNEARVIAAAAALLGPLAVVVAYAPRLALLAMAVGSLLAIVVARPGWTVAVYLSVMPFIAGIDRGRVVPLLRPSEALQLLLMFAVVVAFAVGTLSWVARSSATRFSAIDAAFVAMAAAASIVPIGWMLARGVSPDRDDLLACVPLWKYYALFWLARLTLRNSRDLRRAGAASLGVAAVVAVLAVLQSLDLFGIREQLATWWASDVNPLEVFRGRGTTTLGSAIATAAYLAFNFGLALSWWLRVSNRRHATWLAAAGLAAFVGCLASGQMTGVFALVSVSVVVVSMSTAQRARLVTLRRVALPTVFAVGVVVWPVVLQRLADINPRQGLPQSWVLRLDNLRSFYWPRLGGLHWVLGVRPTTSLRAPETWREQIFLESGYTALLWIGGVPLLAAFGAFVWRASRELSARRRAIRMPSDAFALVAAPAASAALWAVVVLTVFDMHLTLRGGADMTFTLLAMALVANSLSERRKDQDHG